MNHHELDRYLFALSPSEERYKSGEVYDWSQTHRTVSYKGNRSILQVVSFDGSDSKFSRGKPLRHSFVVKKNSRFNPAPEHIHSFVEISYVYAGSCHHEVERVPLVLERNQVLLLGEDCPHSIAALGEEDIMISLMMAPSLLREFLDRTGNGILHSFVLNALNDHADHHGHVVFHSEDDSRLRRFFEDMLCEYLDPSPNADAIILGLLQVIFAELVNVYESDIAREGTGVGSVGIIALIHYIEQNFRTCTQEEVARAFNVSPRYVSKLLKERTGLNYRETVQSQRLSHAARLLRMSKLPVIEVAAESGYDNMTFFYRKFQERYGSTPAEYRASVS